MFEKILVPLDGSELAEMAIPYAEELARRLGSEVTLFHASGPEQQQYKHMYKLYLDSLAEGLAGKIRSGRDDRTAGVAVRTEDGQPPETIHDLVEKDGINLIVMTTAGTSGLRVDKMLGSVADRVCRTVDIPVLLIRSEGSRKVEAAGQLINRLLVPLDGSELGRLAVPLAEELAARLKLSVELFQMVRVIYTYGGEQAPFVDYGKLTGDEEKKVRAEMTALENELKGKGLAVASTVTAGTDAASEIIAVGEKVRADLIAMSTHGRGGLGKFVFGSVAEKVLRYGKTPLLLVHPPAGQ